LSAAEGNRELNGMSPKVANFGGYR